METDVPCSDIFQLKMIKKIDHLPTVGRANTGSVLCTTNPTQTQKRELRREGPHNLPRKVFSTK